jgi:two-component system, OmpR family, phosphate regulon sensor histidine kinase PhoR
MFLRTFSLLFLLILGAVTGEVFVNSFKPWAGAFLGVLFTTLSWYVWNLSRAYEVLYWIKDRPRDPPPKHLGLWGEIAQRMNRVIREQDQKISESEDRLNEFLQAIQVSPNGIILINAQGRIEWSNETALTHLGIDIDKDRDQLIGNLVRDPSYVAYMSASNFEREVVIEGFKSQLNSPKRISLQLFPYGDGRKLMLSRDVTDFEKAELMRRDFVANVSHEIRTPLTVLAGFVETMQNLSLSGEEQVRYLGFMQQQSSRMQILVQDLLTLSKLEGSPMPSYSDWHSVQTLCQNCEVEARGLAEILKTEAGLKHQLIFSHEPEGKALKVSGERAELQSAMSNLISNALRYTPVGGEVRVVSRLNQDGSWFFSVNDTGPGISSEHLPRLTERFYRVDRSRSRETGGTGLGLAIVKHVVQRHGGELKIESILGQGSQFSWQLPKNRTRLIPSPESVSLPQESLSLGANANANANANG